MFKHGHSRKRRHSPENRSYWNMMARCHRTSHPRFNEYGGRGITVCDRWRNGEAGKCGFECFLDDMGLIPGKGLTIERIDNNLGYYKENCRWDSRASQARNRRSNIIVELDAKRMILLDAAQYLGVNCMMVYRRLDLGWNITVALTAPRFSKKDKAHATACIPAEF